MIQELQKAFIAVPDISEDDQRNPTNGLKRSFQLGRPQNQLTTSQAQCMSFIIIVKHISNETGDTVGVTVLKAPVDPSLDLDVV